MQKQLISGVCALAFAVTATAMGAERGASGVEKSTAAAKPVPFPKGYRLWTHVKSMLISDKEHPLYDAFAGVHHIYANDKALKTLQTKKDDYPTGSVFVFDLLEAPKASGAYTEGKRKFVAAIVRDAKKYADMDGWGWQVWEGGDPRKPSLKEINDQKVCAGCHKEVSARGFVFSEWRP